MAEVHAVGGGGPGSTSSATSQSECDICGAHFADQDTLRRHRQKPHLIACKVLNFNREWLALIPCPVHLVRGPEPKQEGFSIYFFSVADPGCLSRFYSNFSIPYP
jgi:hypothetical protein